MPKEETCPSRSSWSLDKIEDRVVKGSFKQSWEDRRTNCKSEDRKRTFKCISCGATLKNRCATCQPFAAAEPMLAIFETLGCPAGDAFHRDVLALTEVRELLQQFEVIRVDATDRTTPVIAPDGARTTSADWFASTDFSRLPALLYVSESGETVFKTGTLVERQRMLDATGLVLERAYAKGWSYQRFARSRAIRRNLVGRSREEAVPVDRDSRSEGP